MKTARRALQRLEMRHGLRLLLLGILAADAAAAQESTVRHAAEGVWYGAYVDYSPCDRSPSGSSVAEVLSGISRCRFTPILYVLEVAVQGKEAAGTITTGPAPQMGSAMQRVLDDERLEPPAGRAVRGTVDRNLLSVATAGDNPVAIEATVRRDRMQAKLSIETGDAEQSLEVRLERCVPDFNRSRATSQCSIDALWRRLVEENSGSRLRPSNIPSVRTPLPGSINDRPFPEPLSSCSSDPRACRDDAIR